MPLNAFQKAALEAYDDGEFAYLAQIEDDADLAEAIAHSGDTLLKFVMIELSSTEDCETAEEAVGRMRSAAHSLDEVVARLQEMEEVPSPPPVGPAA